MTPIEIGEKVQGLTTSLHIQFLIRFHICRVVFLTVQRTAVEVFLKQLIGTPLYLLPLRWHLATSGDREVGDLICYYKTPDHSVCQYIRNESIMTARA